MRQQTSPVYCLANICVGRRVFARTYQLSPCPTSCALSADGMYIKGPFQLIQLNVYSVLFFKAGENRREIFFVA